MIHVLKRRGHCVGVASEENSTKLSCSRMRRAATSSSSIRSTARATSTSTSRSARSSASCVHDKDAPVTEKSFLVAGQASYVAAGYVIYGSSTVLVLTTGKGVHGFTWDPGAGEFFLSHENIRCPTRGNLYSVNEGNAGAGPRA